MHTLDVLIVLARWHQIDTISNNELIGNINFEYQNHVFDFRQ